MVGPEISLGHYQAAIIDDFARGAFVTDADPASFSITLRGEKRHVMGRLQVPLIDDTPVDFALEFLPFLPGSVDPVLIIAPVDKFVEQSYSHQKYPTRAGISKAVPRLKRFDGIGVDPDLV
jgi:hypothetical protein